jgi:hypothetical protein
LFDEFNITLYQSSNGTNLPNLSHLDKLKQQSPPQFRLVPDCHFLISLNNQINFTTTKLTSLIDMAEPLRQFLNYFHRKSDTLLNLLTQSTDFFDRSPTRTEKFREFEKVLFGDSFSSISLSNKPDKLHFDDWKKDLHRLIFFGQSDFTPFHTFVLCDGLPGGVSLREAIRVFPGNKHLFADPPSGRLEAVLDKLNESEHQNEVYCFSAISMLEGRMALQTHFYLFSDRSTSSWNKSTDFRRRNQFPKVVRTTSKATYFPVIHDSMRMFITQQVVETLSKEEYTFSEFGEEINLGMCRRQIMDSPSKLCVR